MTSPLTRALALVDELPWHRGVTDEEKDTLRSAIRDIGADKTSDGDGELSRGELYRAMLDHAETSQCSYMGNRCNSSRCPKHGPIAVEQDDLRALLDAPTPSRWQPPDTAPKGERQVIEAIVENPFKKRMRVTLERMKDGGWWHDFLGRLPADWIVLAWHPADSTELPPDWPR